MTPSKRTRVYLSHPIRGLARDVSKEEEKHIMEDNNKRALMAAAMLRSICPHLDVYCPAEHEEFVCVTYYNDMLSETDILDVDCTIIDGCDLVLYFNHQGKFSHGMEREFKHALLKDKPGVTVKDFTELASFAIANASGRTFHV